MSLAIPRRDTGHATQPLLTSSSPFSPSRVMSTATRHPRRRRRDCLRWGEGGEGRGRTVYTKERYARTYFYHVRGKNCLDTQETTAATCPSRRRNTRRIVNNVAFNIVIYGASRIYAIYKTNGLTEINIFRVTIAEIITFDVNDDIRH